LLRIIKAPTADTPPDHRVPAAPGFVDLSDELQTRLSAAEAEAARIVEDARANADRVRQEAAQQGLHAAREAAHQQAREELAARLETALPALRQVIESLEHARAEQLRQGERHVVRLAIAIAQRLVRRELRQAPDIPVSLIREALELASNSDRITLHLHPRDHQSLHDQLARLTALPDGARPCEVVADPAVEPGACVVQTEFGTIDQQFQTQLTRIEEELLP
jgi:flagellar assembly protein FliH